jgi:hypothetical protein
MILAFKSRLLLLEVFEVDVLEILWLVAFYVMIDRSEINNTKRINEMENMMQWLDRFCDYKTFGAKIT